MKRVKKKMSRYICIHGHFYQPPRENPWLEAIQMQASAEPYHDWNERITEECYATNAWARILGENGFPDEGLIVEIVNNYSKISFNFGPTLLMWLQDHHPTVYQAVLAADRESIERFDGHGSAMAQCYNHMIMPLANARDQRTQVIWGIRDFKSRFKRAPAGMWLPETAVDIPTLEALAEQGIKFTLLAPHQAARIRPLGENANPSLGASRHPAARTPSASADKNDCSAFVDGESEWRDVEGAIIDTRRAYLQRLPSGREIALFFYDGPLSRSIAFEQLLNHGDQFADRLANGFSSEPGAAELAHIATDGESYGHHHRHGEMALAYALRRLERDVNVELTNYAQFLAKHPPRWEVEIREESSWSCAHGIGRWARDCGCHTGGDPHWNQQWRAPLRAALDWLRDKVALLYERDAEALLSNPWAARDHYIDIINDRSEQNVERFFALHATKPLNQPQQTRALKLLEMQRHAMLMFTSCGWFFSELSGIETLQVIEYAGRVVQLAQELFDVAIGPAFLKRLDAAKSNIAEFGSGRDLYEKSVPSPPIGLERVGAHYAINSLFNTYYTPTRIYAYKVEDLTRQLYEAGEIHLRVGHCRITSEVTLESGEFVYAALHLGGHNVTGGIRPYAGTDDLEELISQSKVYFERAETPALVRLLDRSFDGNSFSLRSLFRDEQHQVMEAILGSAIQEAESAYQQVYRRRAPLLRFLADLDIPQPHALRSAAEIVLNRKLIQAFEAAEPNPQRLKSLLAEIKTAHISLEKEKLAFAANARLLALATKFERDAEDLSTLVAFARIATMARELPFEVNFWEAQNICYRILREKYPAQKQRAEESMEAPTQEWVRIFESLTAALRVAITPALHTDE